MIEDAEGAPYDAFTGHRRVPRTEPPKADVSLLLAQILILDGRYKDPSALLDESEALDPKHGAVFIARGDVPPRQGKTKEAKASFEKAREVNPYRAANLAAARLLAPERTRDSSLEMGQRPSEGSTTNRRTGFCGAGR